MFDENLDEFARLLGIDPETLPERTALAELPSADIKCADGRYSVIADAEFEVLKPYLPSEPRHPDATSNRCVLDALLWCRAERRALTHIPSQFGKSEVVRKRAERWAIAGVWDRLQEASRQICLTDRRRAELLTLCVVLGKRGDRIREARRRNR